MAYIFLTTVTLGLKVLISGTHREQSCLTECSRNVVEAF